MQQLLGKMTMMSTLSLFLAILMFIWTNQWYIFFTFLTAIVCISAISMGQEDGFGDRDSFNYLNLAHLKMKEVCLEYISLSKKYDNKSESSKVLVCDFQWLERVRPFIF